MRFPGFVGPAYTLESVNVDCQRLVNMYPEVNEGGFGKNGEKIYYKSTPGLTELLTVGDGPIRCIHQDAVGRIFVVSGNKLYLVTNHEEWALSFIPVDCNWAGVALPGGVSTANNTITLTSHLFYTGLKVRLSISDGGGFPAGTAADTDYWVIKVDDNTIKIATSLTNALAGTAVDITSTGSGVIYALPQLPVLTGVGYSAVSATTDTITSTAHGLYTGLKIQVTSTGDITGSISLLTDYYVIAASADTFKLATSVANAAAGTAIDITAIDGSTNEWTAKLCGANGQDGGTAVTFTTSTGRVIAASSTASVTGYSGALNPTLFFDGSSTPLIYFDWPQSSTILLTASPNTYTPRVLYQGSASWDSSFILWLDSYFIVTEDDTARFYTSELNSVDFDALDFTTSEGNIDNVVAIASNHRDLWVFNELSTEIYTNTGNADFPFERMTGGFLEIGCLAKYSVAKINGALFWLGCTERGQGQIYMSQSAAPQRISTHAIEQAIASYAIPSTATAFAYEWKGHFFYVLNFTEATWVYDMATGMWHERCFTNTTSGALERHLAEEHLFSKTYGVHLIGDYTSNKLYQFDDAVYTDDGDAITRLRTAPHLTGNSNRVFYKSFELDMEVGIGLVSGQGSDPQVMLDWSSDGGHTWSDEAWTSAGGQVGGIGEYKTRVKWRRLGSARDRVFRVKITDPVKVTIMGAEIDVEVGVY